jgi:zinc-binding alcohol dehydrogenase/oxidoreductase
MKAWTCTFPKGQPSLITKEEAPAVAGLTRVKITASALNHRDVWITKGLYPDIAEGITMGSDGAGTIDDREVIIFPSVEWGNAETHQGQCFRVLGVPDHGTFASYIDIDEHYIFDKPKHLSLDEAASLPLAGLTAYRALMVRAQCKLGDKVLITGIGGGVALFAMQYAVSLGCEVYVTSSNQSKIDKAITLGARKGYNYTDDHWTQQLISEVIGMDVIIDGACGSGFNNLIKIANPGARISFYGATRGNIEHLNARAIFWKQLSVLGTTMGSHNDFCDMLAFVDRYKIKPVIDSRFAFDALPEALAYMDAGAQFGKIVLLH